MDSQKTTLVSEELSTKRVSKFPLEDTVEALERKLQETQDTKSSEIGCYVTNKAGNTHYLTQEVGSGKTLAKFMIPPDMLPFFVEGRTPYSGIHGLWRTNRGLERKVIVTSTKIPQERFRQFSDYVTHHGQIVEQIPQYVRMDLGITETRMNLLQYEIDSLQEQNDSLRRENDQYQKDQEAQQFVYKKIFEESFKKSQVPFLHNAFKESDLSLALAIRPEHDSLGAVLNYINNEKLDCKMVVTNYDGSSGVKGSVFFHQGEAFGAIYSHDGHDLHGEEALSGLYQIAMGLESGRIEIYLMNYDVAPFKSKKSLTRRMTATRLGLEWTKDLDESGELGK